MNGWRFNSKIEASTAAIYHLAIHALGIFALASIVGFLVNRLIPYNYILSGLQPFYLGTLPDKIPALLTYVLSIALVFCWLVAILLLTKAKAKVDTLAEPVPVSHVVISGVVGLFTGLVMTYWLVRGQFRYPELLFLLSIWGINLVYPFGGLILTLLEKKYAGKLHNAARSVAAITVCLMTVAISWICIMLVFGELKIKNDFYDIAEKTILEGTPVDNHQFINERHLFGLTKYDPRKGVDAEHYDQRLAIEIPYTEALKDFLSSAEIASNLYFQYDHKNGKLVARAPIAKNDFEMLLQLYQDNKSRANLTNLYQRSLKLHEQEANRYYSAREVEFIKKNRWELYEQTVLGRFFYHHSYMMAPILATVNGVPNFLSVYGVGYTKAYAAILKTFDAVNFQSYLRILYGSYLVYYILFVLLAYKIFGKLESIGLVAFGAALPVIFQAPETFLLAPGFSPSRHWWDILALFSGLLYLRNERKLYLVLLFFSVSVATWWNAEFGLFLFVAVAGACFMDLRPGHWWRPIGYIIMLVLGQIAAVLFTEKAVNPLAKYMLIGFGAPGNSAVQLLISIFSMGMLGVALLYCRLRDQDKTEAIRWQLALGVYIYLTELMVYALWNPAPNHLIGVVLPWFMLLLVFLSYLWPCGESVVKEIIRARRGLRASLIALLVGIPMIAQNAIAWNFLNRLYRDHVLHEWKSPGAQFTTNMEPQLLQDSVAMIQKYSPKGCIAMLSKYDVVLPILSGRCLIGPFVTSADIFITSRESDLLVKSIIEKADVIYIDSDIDRLYIGEIPDKSVDSRNFGAVDIGRGRAVTFSNFKDIFDRISGKYQLESRGPLISVYRRKQ